MIHHISPVQYDYTHGITIFVFGDLQWTDVESESGERTSTDGFQKEAWAQFKHEFKSTKNAYALGLGDYGDWLRPSMRSRVQGALSGDDGARKQLDSSVKHTTDKLLKHLDFLEKKCIGIHSGHHEWEFSSGDNSTQRIAAALAAPYLGWIASTRLSIVKPRNVAGKKDVYAYTIVSTHGNANARRVGGTATWLETNIVSAFGADQYIMGHGCKNLNFTPSERNDIRRNGPAGVRTTLPRCLVVGGFSKGYTDGWNTSYVERNGFSPQPLGWGKITLRLVQTKSGAKLIGSKARAVNATTTIDVDQQNRHPLIHQED